MIRASIIVKEFFKGMGKVKPIVFECDHKTKHKYKLVVKDLETQESIHKLICSKCAKADLENNQLFISLY